jgi:hypothetical protein
VLAHSEQEWTQSTTDSLYPKNFCKIVGDVMHPIPPYPKPPAGAGHKVSGGGYVRRLPSYHHSFCAVLCYSLCYSFCGVQPSGCGVA